MLKIKESPQLDWGKLVAFSSICAICVLGLAVAWVARRSHQAKPQPSPQALHDWSKPDYAATPLRDADAARAQAELDAARRRAEKARPFIITASNADKARLQTLMHAYTTALKAVREPPLLDLTAVSRLEQLQQKKQLVQAFNQANDALMAFLARREAGYRASLNQLGLPAESLDPVMEAYRLTAAQPTALALKMRNDDKRMGAALLGMLDLLAANWGKWQFNPAKQKVDFAERPAQEKFLDYKEELDAASLEQIACQVKLAALESPQ